MLKIILRTLIAVPGLFLASRIVPGVSIDGTGTIILAAATRDELFVVRRR